MLSSPHAIAIGYHGCDMEVGEKILQGKSKLSKSTNDYDWLGHGAYFWENNQARAWKWAQAQKAKGKIKKPFVIGAVISLGNCLDLLSGDHLDVLKEYHALLSEDAKRTGFPLPENKGKAESGEWLLRPLDCAVIEFLHEVRNKQKLPEYSTVRGVFFEGNDLYEGSAFRENNHIQICARTDSAILGYFRPTNK